MTCDDVWLDFIRLFYHNIDGKSQKYICMLDMWKCLQDHSLILLDSQCSMILGDGNFRLLELDFLKGGYVSIMYIECSNFKYM